MIGSVFVLAAILIFQAVLQHIERRELYRLLNGEPEKPPRGKVENPISRHEQVLRGWRDKTKVGG
nr:MAG TPA: hypothetical protein [Caudoviricetes sp.]